MKKEVLIIIVIVAIVIPLLSLDGYAGIIFNSDSSVDLKTPVLNLWNSSTVARPAFMIQQDLPIVSESSTNQVFSPVLPVDPVISGDSLLATTTTNTVSGAQGPSADSTVDVAGAATAEQTNASQAGNTTTNLDAFRPTANQVYQTSTSAGAQALVNPVTVSTNPTTTETQTGAQGLTVDVAGAATAEQTNTGQAGNKATDTDAFRAASVNQVLFVNAVRPNTNLAADVAGAATAEQTNTGQAGNKATDTDAFRAASVNQVLFVNAVRPNTNLAADVAGAATAEQEDQLKGATEMYIDPNQRHIDQVELRNLSSDGIGGPATTTLIPETADINLPGQADVGATTGLPLREGAIGTVRGNDGRGSSEGTNPTDVIATVQSQGVVSADNSVEPGFKDPNEIEENSVKELITSKSNIDVNPSVRAKGPEGKTTVIPNLSGDAYKAIERNLGLDRNIIEAVVVQASQGGITGGEVVVVSCSDNNRGGSPIEEMFGLDLSGNEGADSQGINITEVLSNAGMGIALVVNSLGSSNTAAVLSFTGGVASFIGFIQGPDFKLADLLKMVMKSMPDVQPPLKKDRKDLPSPVAGFMHYMQYIIVAAVFVALKKKAQKVDLDLIYAATVANVNKEKDALRLFINVRMPGKSSRLAAHGSRSVRAAHHTGAHKQKLSLHSKELAELDMDVNKRLAQMKYWANYLSTMKKHG